MLCAKMPKYVVHVYVPVRTWLCLGVTLWSIYSEEGDGTDTGTGGLRVAVLRVRVCACLSVCVCVCGPSMVRRRPLYGWEERRAKTGTGRLKSVCLCVRVRTRARARLCACAGSVRSMLWRRGRPSINQPDHSDAVNTNIIILKS